MADIKRLNYFNSQFLVDRDFNDEQGYHVGMRRRLNRSLHTWGVADGGFALTSSNQSVTVGAGTAIDKDGQEIVLLDAQTISLSALAANTDIYLTIRYQDVQDAADRYTAGGVDNYIRWTERPLLEARTAAPPADGSVIPLAKVRKDAGGNVATPDLTVRPVASSKIDPGSSLTVGTLTVSNNASVNGRVGVGTTSPNYPLSFGSNLANTKLAVWDGGANGGAFGLGVQNGQFRFHLNQTSDRFSFLSAANGTEVATITGGGNLGLGVTAPTRKLEIAGTTGTVLWAGASVGSTANIDLSGHVQLREFSTHGLAYLQARDDTSNRDIGLRIRTQKAGASTPSVAEAITIDGSGKVGIGTTPMASAPKLTVSGIDATVNIETSEVMRLLRPFVPSVKNYNAAGLLVGSFETGISGRTRLDLAVSGPPAQGNNWGSVPDVTVMSLLANGTVGIGTTIPDRSLTIANTAGGNYMNVKDGTREILMGVDGIGGILSVMTNHDLVLRCGGNSEKMRITAGGNVGIGTATIHNPQGWDRTLDVLGASHARLNVRSSTAGVVTSVFSHANWSGARGVIGTESNHPLTFATNYQHRMTIDAAGDVTIAGKLGILGRPSTPLTSGWAGGLRTWDAEVEGSLYAANAYKPGGGPFTSYSDIKLKKNVEPIKYALDRLLQLRGVSFEWIEPETQGNLVGTQIGMVAQDVEKVFPNWVGSMPDGTKHVTVRGFEALTVEALRELNSLMDGLRRRVEAIEQRLGVAPAVEEAAVALAPKEQDATPTVEKSAGRRSKKADPEQAS